MYGSRKTFNSFNVETVSIRNTSSYKVRKLSLKQASTNQMRIIHHLHFTEWPDHGVPQDPKHFLGKYFFVCLLYYLDVLFAVDRTEEKWLSSFRSVKITPDRHAEVAVQTKLFYAWSAVDCLL